MPDEPRNLNRRTSCSNSGSSVPGSRRSRNVTFASADARTERRLDLLAALEDDARSRGRRGRDARDRRLGADLGAERLRRAGDRVRHAAGAALRDAPGAERAVDLAHVVVEQHVRGPGRADALVRADDPRRRHRRLERVGLEPLVEEVRRAHRHELDEHRLLALRQLPRTGGRGRRAAAAARGSLSVGSGGTMPRIGLMNRAISTMSWPYSSYASASLLRPAAQLADRPAVVVDAPQVVAAACLGPSPRGAA